MPVTRHTKPIIEVVPQLVVPQLIVEKVEYKREKHEISDGSTPWDMEFDAVHQGWVRTIQNISVRDEDTGFTKIGFGYKSQFGVYHWWVEQETPQAGVLYYMDQEKRLTEGMKLVIRFGGTSDEDDLYAYVDGFDEKVNL